MALATSAPELSEIDTLTAIEQVIEIPPPPTWEEIVAPRIKRAKAERLEARKKACEASGGVYANGKCEIPLPVVTPVYEPYTPPTPGNGYIIPGWNCVECVRRLTGRAQNANAGYWSASHSTPRIGDVMIFAPGEQGASWAGHVGVVTGINADGTVNIGHCNWWSGQTRFYSTGKYW